MAELCTCCSKVNSGRSKGDIETLCRVVETGHFPCVRSLLQAGTDVNASNAEGNTPLTLAAKNGYVDISTKLIKSGADVNLTDYRGDTAVMWASVKGFPECIEVLGNAGADVSKMNVLDESPVWAAVYHGNSGCIEPLTRQGADVNAVNHNNITPLMEAGKNDFSTCLEKLVSLGADVNKQEHMGKTALTFALEMDSRTCIDILTAAGADKNEVHALMFAAKKGSGECIKELIAAGVEVSYVSLVAAVTGLRYRRPSKWFGNHKAISASQRIRYIRLLLNAGTDVNCKDGDPLIFRFIDESYKSLKFIVKAGADVNAVDDENNTAIMRVLESCYENKMQHAIRCVKLLLRAGAKVDVVSEKNCSALNSLLHDLDVERFFDLKLFRRRVRPKLCKLLFAAGETVNPVQCEHDIWEEANIPHYLVHDDTKLCLKYLCREYIRQYLLQISPVNLLVRVPQLGFPSIITDYLLYEVRLDDSEDDDDDDNDDDDDDG